MIYYGLEDGTFVGNFYNPRTATYREPGESGYVVMNGDDAGDMQKYFDACVNETGSSVSCSMEVGDSYVECVDGCKLQRCEDEESKSGERIKWCKSYQVKTVPQNNTQSLGYVPRSYYCVDQKGMPTQEMGKVSKTLGEDLRNCYYQDEVTLVNRSISGNYAYCRGMGNTQCSLTEEDGKSMSCSSTFAGAFRSINYDPRYRSWYMDTRRLQKPNWSPPYPFFTNFDLGISYSKPIYRMEGNKTVFYGVLALDYRFADISNFLTESYEDDDGITVAIIEEDEPNYHCIIDGDFWGKESTEERPCKTVPQRY